MLPAAMLQVTHGSAPHSGGSGSSGISQAAHMINQVNMIHIHHRNSTSARAASQQVRCEPVWPCCLVCLMMPAHAAMLQVAHGQNPVSAAMHHGGHGGSSGSTLSQATHLMHQVSNAARKWLIALSSAAGQPVLVAREMLQGC